VRSVVQFAVTSLAAVILIAALGAVVVRRLATDEAIDDARALTELAGRSIVEPALDPGLLRGEPEALRRLDRVVRSRVLRGPVVRVKLWSADGGIVYSDEHRLIGNRYRLGAEERKVLDTGVVEAEETDLARPENRFETPGRRLLEVYLPIRTRSGTSLLFEQYVLYSAVTADSRSIWRTVLPPLFGVLVLLWGAQLPLAASLARRLRREQAAREELLVKAADASQQERRRIAADLHDRVVQDLAGISFSLEAAARRSSSPELVATLRAAAAGTRESMRELRSLLVEIYPPRLRDAGLEAALADVLAPAGARGIDASLDVRGDLELPPEVEALLFRTAQEAVRNALAHADPRHLQVSIQPNDHRVTLVVEDDGRGFDPAEAERRRRSGHLGLSLLTDLATGVGGELELESRPGKGTRVRLEVPVA
jgi:signal transduction histidine kinase